LTIGPVLVIGEALVDVVRHAGGDSFEAPGGSPLNVAVALSRLGVDTSLLTALAIDARTDSIVDHLTRSGVALVEGARRLPRTSTATAVLRADGSAAYEFDLAWDPTPHVGPSARVVHAGSLALFLQPGEALVRQRLEERAGTAMISLDPNIRPTLLPDLQVVRRGFERLLRSANVVKLSNEDLAWLYPHVAERDAVRRLLDAGPSLVVVTRGAEGCALASGAAQVDVAAVPTDVVDTIGAGDSFMGGLLWQVLVSDLVDDLTGGRSLSPGDLADLGVAAARVAAITVSRSGADPPWLAELSERA